MRASLPIAVFSLLIGNVVPLIGVLFFSWDLFSVLFFYWLETVVVGLWNIPKICFAGSTIRDMGLKEERRRMVKEHLPTVRFFIFNYGGFTLASGFVLVGFFLPIVNVDWSSFVLPAVVLIIGHGLSFTKNFIGKKEYRHASVDGQMLSPYGRMMSMYMVVLFAGLFIYNFGFPELTLIVLTLVKTTIDLIVLYLRDVKFMKFK